MNPFLLRTALLVPLAAPLCVGAQDAPAPAPPAAPHAGPVADALQSAGKELGAYFSPRANPAQTLANFNDFVYSPETTRKLVTVFGTSHPLIVQQLPAPKNKLKFSMRTPPWRFTASDGTRVDAAPLAIDYELDRAGTTLTATGRWPSLEVAGVTGIASMHDTRLQVRRRRGADGYWYGDTRVSTPDARIEIKPGDAAVDFTGISLDGDVRPRGKLADFRYEVGVKAVAAAGEQVDDFHLGLRINRLDLKAMTDMALDLQTHQAVDATPQQQLAALKPPLRALARQAIANGTSIDIDDFSARYHGFIARVTGHVGLAGATAADADSMALLVKKIVAHFEVSVPLALFKAIGAKVDAKVTAKVAAEGKGSVPDAPLVSEFMLGKMVSEGYVRVEKDVLRSTIDFAGGALRVNGKSIGTPPVGNAAPAAPALPAQLAPPAAPADGNN